jgi:hypothetical protein
LSVEDKLKSIENQYNIALSIFDKMAGSIYSATKENLAMATKAALEFQRNIELLYEDTKSMSDKKTEYYISRCCQNLTEIRVFLRGGDRNKGALEEANNYDCSQARVSFRRIMPLMFSILEDVRMIYALRIYPIEEKLALKSTLTDYGFLEVTKCLDEAESNLAAGKREHRKDCVDRSREALEKTIAAMLAASKKTPSGSFATDMGTLTNMGIVDKEPKKLIEATYSYLSEVGAHGRSEEVSLGDAHYAMKETYMRIDILLKKYAEFLTAREKGEKQ